MDVVTIGDALVCMNPTVQGPLQFVHHFEKKVGGAELNVALGCARLGLDTGWMSSVGKDPFGKYVISFAKGQGIDTSTVQYVDDYPTSIYFKEILNQHNINSYYYRDQSPTSQMTVDMLPYDYFKQAKIFHFSGVFAAVCESNRQLIWALLKEAKANEIMVTFDVNLRLKLWTLETAKEVIYSFLHYVDVLFVGEDEAELLFGTGNIDELITLLQPYHISTIVLKLGEKGAVAARHHEKEKRAPQVKVPIVDVIGAGDGFAAGFIYSLLQNWQLGQALEFANAVAAHVISIPGDNEGLPTLEEVETLLGTRNHIAR